jgi:AraC family transcriptional regulator of adaptative response / DNA-3-methyladenine glycosylase II
MARRLVERFGEIRSTPLKDLDRVFPDPQRLVKAPLEEIGITKSRAVTLRAVAAAIMNGYLDFRCGQRLDEFVDHLMQLPGVGAWTAHYVAMRALNHPDAFPAGDLVIQRALGFSKKASDREMQAISQGWRPWRAYAVVHLWHLAADL